MRSFFGELKRRNVLRAGALYVGAAWALSQGLAQLLPVFAVPNWIVRWFVIAAIVGFPFAMLFSWVYEWTPQGLRRDGDVEQDASIARQAARKMGRWIIAALGAAVALLLADKFVLHRDADLVLDKSVAVLPLVNESGDPQQDYFSDGLSEELISALAQVHDLRVIGRSSSFRFRGRQQDDTAAIGAKLAVATLLEGTVRRQGARVRIVTSLVKAVDGSQLWSAIYERELKDVFAVQSEIAASVAGALKTTLLGKTIEAADKPPGGNLEAYNALLQGRFHAERRNRADYLKAVDYYRQAITLDPGYALAYARLAIAEQWFIDWEASIDERAAAKQSARANAQKAVELAPQSAVALGALGIVQAWSNIDYPAAEVALKKAVALDPSNAETLYQLADVTGCLGRLDEAVAMMRKALAMEPLNATFHFYTGEFLLALGRHVEAQAELQQAVDLQPGANGYRATLALALMKRGQVDRALVEATAEPSGPDRRQALAMIYFYRGDKVQAQAQLDEMIRLDGQTAPGLVAEVFAFEQNADQAFVWLDRAAQANDSVAASVYEAPDIFRRLGKDPRFTAFTRKVGLPDPASVPPPAAETAQEQPR